MANNLKLGDRYTKQDTLKSPNKTPRFLGAQTKMKKHSSNQVFMKKSQTSEGFSLGAQHHVITTQYDEDDDDEDDDED